MSPRANFLKRQQAKIKNQPLLKKQATAFAVFGQVRKAKFTGLLQVPDDDRLPEHFYGSRVMATCW